MIKPYLHLKKTKNKGKGIFTKEKIHPNTIVEKAPVLIISKEDRVHIEKTLLHDYIFEWGKANDKVCLALGHVSMYNHNYNSNCEYIMDLEENIITIKTVKAIEKGEELTINYNGDVNNTKTVWFDVKD